MDFKYETNFQILWKNIFFSIKSVKDENQLFIYTLVLSKIESQTKSIVYFSMLSFLNPFFFFD